MILNWYSSYKTNLLVKSDFFKIFMIERKVPKGWYMACSNNYRMYYDLEELQKNCVPYIDYKLLLKMFKDCGAKIFSYKFFGEKKCIPYFQTKELAEIFYITLKIAESSDYRNIYKGITED